MASIDRPEYTTNQLPEQLRVRGVNATEPMARAAAQEIGLKNGVYSPTDVDRIAAHLKNRMGNNTPAAASIPEPPRKAVTTVEQEPEPQDLTELLSEEDKSAAVDAANQFLTAYVQVGAEHIARQLPTANRSMVALGMAQARALAPANFTQEEG